MSFGPGDMGSTQYWHRQSFPLKVTLSPAGNGRLEGGVTSTDRSERHELWPRGKCKSLLAVASRLSDGAEDDRTWWCGCVSTLWPWGGRLVRWRWCDTQHGTVRCQLEYLPSWWLCLSIMISNSIIQVILSRTELSLHWQAAQKQRQDSKICVSPQIAFVEILIRICSYNENQWEECLLF